MPIHKHHIIAVDFDGTIVEDRYPKIGKEQLFAFSTMKKLQSEGHRLILWTVRAGKRLHEAEEFCNKNGIEFYAVNKNYPEEVLDSKTARKIYADIFIDDRNINGFIGWRKVHQIYFENNTPPKEKSKNIFSFFKR
jgi:hydroxymethylpyrimidine pyrophosphatase-like HAD family hydrolase